MHTDSIGSTPPEHSHDLQEASETSYTFGRCIRKIGSYALDTLKVVGVVGLFFGLALVPVVPALASMVYCNGDFCYHSNTPPGGALSTNFPGYTARYMNAGMQLVHNGTAACAIENPPETAAQCAKTISAALKALERENILAHYESDATFSEKGVALDLIVDGKTQKLNFRMNYNKFFNYEHALRYIERTIFTSSTPFQEGASKTIETIKNIHLLLTQNLPTIVPNTPGEYRTHWTILDGLEEPKTLIPRAHEKLSPEEFEKFTRALITGMEADGNLSGLTQEELDILNKVIYIPPGPDQIGPEMQLVAEELERRLKPGCNPIDYVDLAGTVHSKLARIWAFGDANIRLPLIMMNTILRLGGHDPVVIDSHEGYTAALIAGIKNPAAFTDYLRDHLIPWTETNIHVLT